MDNSFLTIGLGLPEAPLIDESKRSASGCLVNFDHIPQIADLAELQGLYALAKIPKTVRGSSNGQEEIQRELAF